MTDLYLLRELDGLRREIAELRERVAILEAVNKNVVRVKLLTAEQLAQQMRQRYGGRGNVTQTPAPEFFEGEAGG